MLVKTEKDKDSALIASKDEAGTSVLNDEDMALKFSQSSERYSSEKNGEEQVERGGNVHSVDTADFLEI